MQLATKILLPIDLTDVAPPSLEYAAQLARKRGTRIILVHVLEVVVLPQLYDIVETEAERHQRAYDQLNSWRARLDGVDADVVILDGDAAEQILDYARTVDADLIVMATHGRRKLDRFMLGSTTERVVRRSTCPVLSMQLAGVPA